jgi:hypothetical protein
MSRSMPDYITRMVEEKAQLDERLKKLCDFKYTNRFDHLPYEEQERLNTQGHFMCAYSAILGERIRFAEAESQEAP